MKNKRAGVAKVVALGVVPLGLAAAVAKVGQQHRAEAATKELLQRWDSRDIRQDSVDETIELLSQGADVHARDWQGRTPLHMAAWYSRSIDITVLLAEGADINARDKTGRTPLNTAVEATNVGGIELLLRARADIHQPMRGEDGKDYKPLATARDMLRPHNHPTRDSIARTHVIIQMLKAAGAKE
jgi:ankyrin repeat protein